MKPILCKISLHDYSYGKTIAKIDDRTFIFYFKICLKCDEIYPISMLEFYGKKLIPFPAKAFCLN